MYRAWRRGPLGPCGVTRAALADWSRHFQPFSMDSVGSAGPCDGMHRWACLTNGCVLLLRLQWLEREGTV